MPDDVGVPNARGYDSGRRKFPYPSYPNSVVGVERSGDVNSRASLESAAEYATYQVSGPPL